MAELLIDIAANLRGYHYLIIAINVIAFFLARPLVERLSDKTNEHQTDFHINVLRGLNLGIFASIFFSVADLFSGESNSIGLKILSILIVLYLAYLLSNIASSLLRRNYGKVSKASENITVSDTYHSRMLSLLTSTFIGIVALITIIRIAGLNSLLEAGGVIGFIGVFLALTQAAWAPDIISGLILLNSDMVSEGDLIEINAPQPLLARVFKTKVFHTVLIDVVDNHRVMISNSRLRSYNIHSLSKFASARGLREKLTFKIGYDTGSIDVKQLFNEAFATACADEKNDLDESHPLEIRVLETGDHAVEWGIFYYLKDVSNLVANRQTFLEHILETSIKHGISLATPKTHVVTQRADQTIPAQAPPV